MIDGIDFIGYQLRKLSRHNEQLDEDDGASYDEPGTPTEAFVAMMDKIEGEMNDHRDAQH